MAEMSYKWFETRNWLPVTERLNQCINSINSSIFKYFNAGTYKPPASPLHTPSPSPLGEGEGVGSEEGGCRTSFLEKYRQHFNFMTLHNHLIFFLPFFAPS